MLLPQDRLIPLRPIPFYSQCYGRDHQLTYRTEHERVVEYIEQLHLEDYIGAYDPRQVVVLTDSGYDSKKIPQAIAAKSWHFIIALGKTRSVQSATLAPTAPKAKQWCHIATFFRNHRWLKWQTLRLLTKGTKRKRMELRARDTIGYLRYGGRVQLVCSEPRNRPEGRRKYFACKDMRGTARQILLGYRLRWTIEVLQSQDIKFTRSIFFFPADHNRWFFKRQHVMDFDRPIWIHHHLCDDKLDHRLTVLVA